MLKILYAAADEYESRIPLYRFLQAIKGLPYIVKVAAYQASTPKGVSIDWTLNCCNNVIGFHTNEMLYLYYHQVKSYNPDLIISDLEINTSNIAISLNKPLWQCSSLMASILNYILTKNGKKFYIDDNPYDKYKNITINADKNLVYSHFGDVDFPISLRGNFRYVRPYHKVGKKSTKCNTILTTNNDKKLFSYIKEPTRIFTENLNESYKDCTMHSIYDEELYYDSIYNSDLVICDGSISFLADAFYNNKYALIYSSNQTYNIVNNIKNSMNLDIAKNIYYKDEDLAQYKDRRVIPVYKDTKYLHEIIEEEYG